MVPAPTPEVTHDPHLTLISASEPSWEGQPPASPSRQGALGGPPSQPQFPPRGLAQRQGLRGRAVAHSPLHLSWGCPPPHGMRDWVWPLPGTPAPVPLPYAPQLQIIPHPNQGPRVRKEGRGQGVRSEGTEVADDTVANQAQAPSKKKCSPSARALHRAGVDEWGQRNGDVAKDPWPF